MGYKFHFLTVVIFCLSSFWSIVSYSQIEFPLHSEYSYLKGSQAASLSDDWMSVNFDDSSWATGMAPFRYGDGTGGTVLADMQYNYSTVYMRTTFSAAQVNSLKKINFTVDYDDGFVIWINNQEVFRRNAPDYLAYNAFAKEYRESGVPELIVIDSSNILLNEGLNVIAVQGFNFSLESSDFYFDLEFNALPSLPASSDVSFSHPSGFYDAPFDLTLTSNEPGTSIAYTLDGSDPSTAQSALLAGDEITLTIDPASTINRPATPAVVVRASLAKDGFENSDTRTHTFIFTSAVKNQQHPGGAWPVDNINEQVIDLEMDEDVVNHPLYTDSIVDALLDIPSIAVSTDLANLFDPATGIYVNAWGHGPAWERPCSVELLNPDGTQGFQVNAGLRIRGGWSRHPEFPKHSFRLFFRNQYGASKLEYPLFENEGVSSFDKIDLRTSQNYAWANWDGNHNTMVRDVFSRESQGASNQPYTRSRYYHLYLNGMYWGIFQTQERSEARYASDYLGGENTDYDVIKVNTEDYIYEIEATDGSLESWEQLWNLCNPGFANNAAYFHLEGKDEYGQPVVGSQILVEIDNLIDYMINIFYTGNFDAPTSSFGANQGPNNFYAIFNHDDKSKGFVFFVHDAEHAMMVEPVGPGFGLYENRVEPYGMYVDNMARFHPQWIHHMLTENEEYRIRFADRAFKHLAGQGIFTPAQGKKRFNDRVQELTTAIMAESARWGDSHTYYPYTKHNAWLPEIEAVNDVFFPNRTAIVIDQLQDAGLFLELHPPVIKRSDTELLQGDYYLQGMASLTFENNNPNGTIYYTLSGDDPRSVGGTVSNWAHGIQHGGTIQVSASTIIQTRILNGTEWSAINTYRFFASDDDFSNLKVTELHYHPKDQVLETDTISGKSFEFIEFLNSGETALNLSGCSIESAVDYVFPNKTLVPPKGYVVIATKPKYFYEAYGRVVHTNCSGFFSNSGEYILLKDSIGNEILSFTYADHDPWPELADGEGYSLTANEKYPTGDPNNFSYWMPSSTLGGSPFAPDSLFTLSDQDYFVTPETLMVYPNPAKDRLYIDSTVPDDPVMHYSLFNSYGAIIYQSTFRKTTAINLQSLGIPAGLYFLLIESENFRTKEKVIFMP